MPHIQSITLYFIPTGFLREVFNSVRSVTSFLIKHLSSVTMTFPLALKHDVVQPLLKQVGQQQLYFVLQKSLFHLHVIVNVL